MIIFLTLLTIFQLGCIIFLIKKLNDLLKDVLNLESNVSEYDTYLTQVKHHLEQMSVSFNTISKYPVVSNDPIVQSLVKLVNEKRDVISTLIDQFNQE